MMANDNPITDLNPHFSSPNAAPVPWTEARRALEKAEIYWLTTVRPEGRPHVTPLVAVWEGTALYFSSGRDERKAMNLEENSSCVVTTGCNSLDDGLDIVVEGEAVRITDEDKLQQIAERYNRKYGPPFNYTVRENAFYAEPGIRSLVFEVKPSKGFGFGRGEAFSQTRWQFE